MSYSSSQVPEKVAASFRCFVPGQILHAWLKKSVIIHIHLFRFRAPVFFTALCLSPPFPSLGHISGGKKGGPHLYGHMCYVASEWPGAVVWPCLRNRTAIPFPGGSKVTKLIKSFPPTERSPISLATPPSLVLAASGGGGFSTSCQISPPFPPSLYISFPFPFLPLLPPSPLFPFLFPLPPPPYPPFSRRVHCPHDPASERERSGGCRRERERRESKSACFAVSPTANPGLTAGCPPSSSSTRACQDLLLLPVFSVLSPAGGPRRRRRRSRYT